MNKIFDASLSEAAKDEGMARAAFRRKRLLNEVRIAMINLAAGRPSRTADADDVQRWIQWQGYTSWDLGNAAGCVFRSDWVFTGEWKPSTRVKSHARPFRVWRLKDEF